MSVRTYIPMLLFLAHQFCKYVVRYRPTIDAHLTTDAQRTALTVAVNACQAFTALVPPDAISD